MIGTYNKEYNTMHLKLENVSRRAVRSFLRRKLRYLCKFRYPSLVLFIIWITYEIIYEPAVPREEMIKNVDNKIKEELKYDKGTGCDMPKLNLYAKEIMKFMKKTPKITCNHTIDWVKCYLSKCRVVKKILDNFQDIKCTYYDILYISDHDHRRGRPAFVPAAPAGEYTLRESDHVKVSCRGLDKSGKKANWNGYAVGYRDSVTRKPPPPGREDTLNVLILGFDSTSKNGFIRNMPLSYYVLKEELNAVILNSYNIVGGGTEGTLFPILTGKNELELPECRKSVPGSGYIDPTHFIFYKLRDDGYRTAYFEDMPWIGTFQFRLKGFKRQPADHYLRAFFVEESGNGRKWKEGSDRKYCCGDISQYKLMLNVTDQFFKLDGKRFCFTFIADISHDETVIGMADVDVSMFLRDFQAQGRLEDTLLIIMGDHGPRYSDVRNTYQGKLEERLPLMAIVLPEKLKASRPRALEALKHNAEVLTTPHDIHATILDVLDMRQHYNLYKVKGADLKRGLSLLEPVPRNRSCSEAAIEPHWCACLKWTTVQSDDPICQKAAQALVDKINSMTEFMRSKCAIRTLTSIEWVMRTTRHQKVVQLDNAKDFIGHFFAKNTEIPKENFQVKLTVGPGKGTFEASMVHLKDLDKFTVSPSEISRVNAYGNEPSCISEQHPRLNMFCYCKS